MTTWSIVRSTSEQNYGKKCTFEWEEGLEGKENQSKDVGLGLVIQYKPISENGVTSIGFSHSHHLLIVLRLQFPRIKMNKTTCVVFTLAFLSWFTTWKCQVTTKQYYSLRYPLRIIWMVLLHWNGCDTS